MLASPAGAKFRAIFLAVFLHVAPVALILFFSAQPSLLVSEDKKADDSLTAQAPIGDVFVTEAAMDAPAAPHFPSDSPPPSAMEFPSEVKKPEAEGGAPGLPDGEAVPIGKIVPSYPPLSRNLGEEGEAVFMIAVGETGRVSEAELEKTSGHDRLDEAARDALLAASFEPARKGGAPLASRKRFRVEFRLDKK